MKGVFTRDRRPKMAAHFLRERWTRPPTQLAEAKAMEPAATAETPPFFQALTRVAQKLDEQNPETTATLKFNLTGEGIYRLVIEEGHCRAEQGDGEATAAVTMKAQDAVKLMTGKLNPVAAMMTGKFKVEGDLKTLMILQNAL
jgi:putative sterol carrier protein